MAFFQRMPDVLCSSQRSPKASVRISPDSGCGALGVVFMVDASGWIVPARRESAPGWVVFAPEVTWLVSWRCMGSPWVKR